MTRTDRILLNLMEILLTRAARIARRLGLDEDDFAELAASFHVDEQ